MESGFGGQGGGGGGGDAGQGEAFDGGAYEGADASGEFYDDGQGYDYGDQYGGGYEPGYGAPAVNPGATASALNNVIQAAVAQQVAPIQQEMANRDLQAQANQIVTEFPDLGTEQGAAAAIEAAHEIARNLGIPAQLVESSPGLWRAGAQLIASRAAQPEQQPQDPGDAIVHGGDGLGRGALPFH